MEINQGVDMMTFKNKILALLLAMSVNVLAAAWTGASTEPSTMKTIGGKKYYVINNADELAWFSDQVNNGQTTINAYLNKDIYFAIDKDSISKIAWSPIGGSEELAFNGVFDGNNYGIYGLLSKKENSSLYGLFGVIGENGVVKNLMIKADIISNNNRNGNYGYTADISGLVKLYLGGIAAINFGNIENCHTFGNVSVNNIQYAQNLNGGGIAGWNKGVIKNVSSNQAVSIYTFSYDGKYYAGSCGGIVGINEGIIEFATNNSSISPQDVSRAGDGNRGGGIAGVNYGIINKSINKGTVTGRAYIGGIAGINGSSASIDECINEGNFLNTKDRVGALVGDNYGALKTSYSVSSSFLIWGSGKQIGAVVGADYGDVNTCYFDSDLLADFTAVGYGTGVNVSGKTTKDMQNNQFAWILNTANGSEENSGVWSRYEGYPVFANDTLLPIRKIIYDDGQNTTINYTNYKGLVSVFPEVPQAPEGKAFAGWFNSDGKEVNLTTIFLKDQTVTAKFLDWEDFVYSIRFLDENGKVLDLQSVHSGEIPIYGGSEPTKKATVAYTYSFAGWSPEITAATWHTDYQVLFDSTLNQYKVTYLDYDGTELYSAMFDYGKKPSYSTIPKREKTVAYIYAFAGWSPTVEFVSGEATYKAVYDSTLQKYTIQFMNGEKSLLSKDVEYGTVPKYDGDTPTKPATKEYSYSFVGWTPEISKVTKATSYTAKFDSTLNKYMVVFQNGAKVLQDSEVEYGKIPTYKGETPQKTSTAKYDYAFSSWSPALTKVTDQATYTALFDSTIRSYEIAFVSEGKTLQAKEVEYGVLPKYEGKDPSKSESKGYTYSFKGWNPSITMVKEKTTYTAVFDSVVKKFTITFMNGKDTLQSSSVAYGATPEYKGKTPTKTGSSKYDYKFTGWSPKLVAVTDKAVYKAVFDSTKLAGIPSSRQINSNLLINVNSRNIQISAAPVGHDYALFDMQGRVLQRGRIESANYNIVAPHAGSYFIRIENQTSKVEVK